PRKTSHALLTNAQAPSASVTHNISGAFSANERMRGLSASTSSVGVCGIPSGAVLVLRSATDVHKSSSRVGYLPTPFDMHLEISSSGQVSNHTTCCRNGVSVHYGE